MEYLAFLHRNTCSPNHCPFVFAELVDTCKTLESTLPDFFWNIIRMMIHGLAQSHAKGV